ncbi:MAG: cobalamin-dependent protein [Paludibacter sp.]|jgi:methanogenic corrinoid protein MtbC1|nr:cobalamin-dependent protein [Paludibacter sp.]
MTAITTTIYQHFLTSLLSGNKSVCSQIVGELLSQGIKMDDLYENLLKKAMYEVGELWETNKISVATEHLTSLIVENILSEMYFHLKPSSRKGKKVVLGCVPGEQHQIGIKMTNDVFEQNGWETYFLGANVPSNDFIRFSKGVQPHVFGLSLSLHFNLPNLESMILEIRKQFPKVPVIVGGQAFTHGGSKILKQYEKAHYLKNLYELEQYIHALTTNTSTTYSHKTT